MREQMHPIYTAVPARSVRAYAKSDPPKLEEILCAAIVDPDNAEDAFDEYGVKRTPHSLQDFWEWRGAKGIDIALQVSSQWTMRQKSARLAIEPILWWDRRVGVWCACQVAREVLRFVPEREVRPRIAIEMAERWAAGDVAMKEIVVATDAAFDALRGYEANLGNSVYEVVIRASVRSITFAAYVASGLDPVASITSVSSAAAALAWDFAANIAVGDLYRAFDRARDAELVRLREVVANACMTFPR